MQPLSGGSTNTHCHSSRRHINRVGLLPSDAHYYTSLPLFFKTCSRPRQHKRHRLQQLTPVQAQSGHDKASVAALEAAIGAINGILSTYTKAKQATKGAGPASHQLKAGNTSIKASAVAGPSKLISFTAKAATSVPVKELLFVSAASSYAASSSDRTSSSTTGQPSIPSSSNANSPNSSNGHSSSQQQHHGNSSSKASKSARWPSWLQQLARKSSSNKDGNLPPEALSRSLQAYLSLPLEQYSVLDPKLITRLSPGADVEAVLAGMLAERAASKDYHMAACQQQQQQAQVLQGSHSSSSSSNGGHNQAPVMCELHLQEPSSRNTGSSSSNNSRNNRTSSNGPMAAAAANAATAANTGNSTALQEAAATATLAASSDSSSSSSNSADGGSGSGAFLLHIPMLELLGLDLEPLLVVYVDIDPVNAQVKFHTNRLVVGDPRFDQEFKVNLTATLGSKVTQMPVLLAADLTPAAGAEVAGSVEQVIAVSASNGGSKQQQGTSIQQESQARGMAAQQQAAIVQQTTWQRNSKLTCKIKLGMSLRVPHPLSIVPGPLLSTTAGLVAKLVIQALLPSFLDLLATDYNRWAAGSSTAARQAEAAGSLLAGGKQQLQKQLQQ